MATCKTCKGDYDEEDMTPSGACRFCVTNERYAAFARSCGLDKFPDPTGERYLYDLDGDCSSKKSEDIDFMDELWAALVRAKGDGNDLIPGYEDEDEEDEEGDDS